jgi:hypothetical protein
MNENTDEMNMDDDMEEIEFETLEMTDEDGETVSFIVLDSVTDEKGVRYLLVTDEEFDIEEDDDDDEIGDVGLLKEIAEDDENFTYEFVDDEKEIGRVVELFKMDDKGYTIDV